MGMLYTKLLDMSLQGSMVIAVVLLIRYAMRRLPKVFSYALWAVVVFRLLCPFSIEAPVNVIPDVSPVAESYTLQERDISFISAGVAAYRAVGDALNGGLGVQHIHTEETDEQGYEQTVTASCWEVWVLFGQYVWLFGVTVFGVYSLISWLRLRRRLVGAMHVGENIYLADHIPTPFVLGLFSPKIYLPSGLEGRERAHILAHEQHHIRRGDHIAKLLAFVALALHWFNPLVWVAYFLFCKDMEMSCDEAVLKKLGTEIRADYAASLLKLATGKRGLGIMPLAFGEGDTKDRILNLSKWKKHKVWIVVAAGAAVAVAAVLLALSPVKTLDAKLTVFVDCQIAEHNQTEETKGRASCVNWELLGKERKGRKTVLYLWVLYEEYSMEEGTLKVETGSHIPVVITATEDEGQYRLAEYWIPRDGTYYAPDIKAKFPWYLHRKALDSQRYIKKQKAENEKLALEYFEEQNKSDPVPGGVAVKEAFTVVTSYAGYSRDSKLFSESLNALTFAQSSVQHLPVFRFSSGKDVENFISKYGDCLTLDQSYEGIPSFSGVAERYDEAFFEDNQVLLVYVPASNSADRYEVGRIEKNTGICLHIQKNRGTPGNSNEMVGWILTVTVPHSFLNGINGIDADLDNFERLSVPAYEPVTVVETDQQDDIHQIQAVLPVTDFSSVSTKVKDAVAKEWETYDGMTRWERSLSSHLYGCIELSAESWKQWQQDTGISLENPLAGIQWLSPAIYTGGSAADPETPHIKTTLYATSQTDRKLSEIHLSAGYKVENTRVVLSAIMWNQGGIYSMGIINRVPTMFSSEEVTSGSGMPVLLTCQENGEASYSGLEAWWVQDSALFNLRVVGDKAASTEVRDTMDKLLAEI